MINSETEHQVVHPGVFLAEILLESGISQSELARRIGVSRMSISHIINGKRHITVEMACLLGKVFNQTPQCWLRLQTNYDLETIDPHLKKRLELIQPMELASARE